MKHTLIAVAAAAAALVAGTAHAQSSVQIYGRLNVTLERQSSGGAKTYQMVNNASRLGFKGTEDLGGGLKAGFILEHGFNVDNGSASQSRFWARQSEVNLSGGFGMLRLGNFTSEAYFATADYISMHNHDTGPSSDALYAYLGNDTNKVAYRTPEFVKGMTIEAAVSAGERVAKRGYDLAWNYNMGALQLGAGYQKQSMGNQYALRALYELGPVVLGVMVQRDKNGWFPDGVPGPIPGRMVEVGTRTNYRLTAAYNVGSMEFHANIGRAGDYSKVANSDATQYTLGYNYNLSKRTKVYGYLTKINASDNTPYASDFSSIAAFGVRHNF
jgi:predicted porin